MVGTMKEFHNIILGHQITVYTDHKNLTYNFFNTERVMRWRLILEYFGPELKYIKDVIGREVLFAYPYFNALFEIYTHAYKLQNGAVIFQKGNSIAFYSRKMNSAQQNYTTTEK